MGILFWWPVNTPLPEMRLRPLISITYLFSACVAYTILGIVITFSSVGLYSAYMHPNDALGILSIIRGGWGISPRVDQQIGGLLMWVPCCIFEIGTTTAVIFKNASPLPWAGVTANSALFMCPCHGGVYYEDGEVAAGPPPRLLPRYSVRVRNRQVEILASPIPLTTTKWL